MLYAKEKCQAWGYSSISSDIQCKFEKDWVGEY